MSTKKATQKKAPAKKPAPAKKKTVAKKSAAPAKKPVAKKLVAKKPAAPSKKVPAKKAIAQKQPTQETASVDESVATRDFAYSIAEMMKRANRQQEAERAAAKKGVRLSRRPTSRAKGKETMKFPASDLAEFKKRLILLRQAATGQSATLKTIALEQTDDRGGEDEDGSDAFLRLQSLSQADSQNRVIHKIDDALRRIADGTYGICEMCGRLIRKPRLMNMPFAHTCMECQSEMESPFGNNLG